MHSNQTNASLRNLVFRLMAACLLLLQAACNEPNIERFEVTPNPIPAPTADAPTAFKVGVQATSTDDLSCSILLQDSENSGIYLFVDDSGKDACVNYHEITCTSSLSKSDANLREVQCSPVSNVNNETVFHVTRKAGTQLVFQASASYTSESVVETILKAPFDLGSLGNHSSKTLAADLQ